MKVFTPVTRYSAGAATRAIRPSRLASLRPGRSPRRARGSRGRDHGRASSPRAPGRPLSTSRTFTRVILCRREATACRARRRAQETSFDGYANMTMAGPRAPRGAPRPRYAPRLAARRSWSRLRRHGDACLGSSRRKVGAHLQGGEAAPGEHGVVVQARPVPQQAGSWGSCQAL